MKNLLAMKKSWLFENLQLEKHTNAINGGNFNK